MATSTIKNPGNFKTISIYQDHLVEQANTWEYTGLSVTIPPHTAYGIDGLCQYANSQVINAAFSASPNSCAHYERVAIAGPDGETSGDVYKTGYNSDAVPYTYYLWGKWDNIAYNGCYIKGWLYTPNQD